MLRMDGERANALSSEVIEALQHGVDAASSDAGVHTLVLFGNETDFNTGFDLSDLDRHTDGDQALRLLRGAGVPCAPINSYSQALADPQVENYGWMQPTEPPGGAISRTFTNPLGRALPIRRRPPALGEHTNEVLSEVPR